MKKLLLCLAAFSFCGAAQAVDYDLVKALYWKEWSKAETRIEQMLNGDCNECLEAALAGIYMCKITRNMSEIQKYEWIVHTLMNAAKYGNEDY